MDQAALARLAGSTVDRLNNQGVQSAHTGDTFRRLGLTAEAQQQYKRGCKELICAGEIRKVVFAIKPKSFSQN